MKYIVSLVAIFLAACAHGASAVGYPARPTFQTVTLAGATPLITVPSTATTNLKFNLNKDGTVDFNTTAVSGATLNINGPAVNVNAAPQFFIQSDTLFLGNTCTSSIGNANTLIGLGPASKACVFAIGGGPLSFGSVDSGLETFRIDNTTSVADFKVAPTISGKAIATVSLSGSYTATVTGCTTAPTLTVYYELHAGIASIRLNNSMTCTSNATTLTLTGSLPAAMEPASGVATCDIPVLDNTATITTGELQVIAGTTTLNLTPNNGAGAWTNVGLKGIRFAGMSCTYPIGT